MESGDLKRIPDTISRVKQIIVDEKKFTIHCYRYAAKSDFFHILLTQEFIEKNMRSIRLQGIDSDVFSKVHILLNTGQVDLEYEDAVDVYIACRYLLVKDIYLVDLQAFVINSLDHLNVFDLFDYCVTNLDPLLERIKEYLAPKVEQLYETEKFKSLSAEAVAELVNDHRIKITKEDSICWIIASWLVYAKDRKKFLIKILQKIAPTKVNPELQITFEEEEWNLTTIADTLYYIIFEWQPRIPKPLKSEFFKSDEPLYISNEEGLLLVTHYEGTHWSILNGPRKAIHPSTNISAAARLQADLFVATSELKYSQYRFETNMLHYNFRSNKIIKMSNPAPGEIKGLHLINRKLFSNTKDIVQQYCAEHDLWLNPIDIGLSHYQFSATDSQCLFVGGYYDWSGCNSVHFYDPRSPEWIYFADTPKQYQGTCGTFIGDDLFMMALGNSSRDWYVLKLDVRNGGWETISNHLERTSATPVSIRQCRKDLIVMDHYYNVYTVPVAGGTFHRTDRYQYSLKPLYSVD